MNFKVLLSKHLQRQVRKISELEPLQSYVLCSTDQQRLINNMFDDVNYCQVDIGDSAVDRLPDESEAFIRLGTFTELLATFPWHWEGFSRLWELSGDDQSRYAEFFLGLSTFCIRTQASYG